MFWFGSRFDLETCRAEIGRETRMKGICVRLAHKSACRICPLVALTWRISPMLFRVFVVAAMAAAALPLSAQSTAAQTDLAASVERQLPALTETYKYLHRNPELSRHAEKTSAYEAAGVRKLSYMVTEHEGKNEDGGQAFGVVAVLENGPVPRLL